MISHCFWAEGSRRQSLRGEKGSPLRCGASALTILGRHFASTECIRSAVCARETLQASSAGVRQTVPVEVS
jgi:hypothetical protein